MSDTKFTPGPWVVTFRRDGSACISMGGLEPGQQHKQFDLLLRKGESNDEADAALIAAAPDMFAALEMLVDYDKHDGGLASVLNAAAAALRKARGQA